MLEIVRKLVGFSPQLGHHCLRFRYSLAGLDYSSHNILEYLIWLEKDIGVELLFAVTFYLAKTPHNTLMQCFLLHLQVDGHPDLQLARLHLLHMLPFLFNFQYFIFNVVVLRVLFKQRRPPRRKELLIH